MNKTPIMVLQELGVKECVIPSYDVILSPSGTHANTFTFRVKYKDLYADGTASNKKEAKQYAAQNMLELLQQSNNISSKGLKILTHSQSNVVSLKSCNPTLQLSDSLNYIGILQEYCVQNRLTNPHYELRQISGPPHQMKFTMACTLGSITEEAIAATKKQAKQQVAQKVLHNLPNVKNIRTNNQCGPVINNNSDKKTRQDILKDLGLCIANLKITDSTSLENTKLKFLNATTKKHFKSLLRLNEKVSVDCYHLYFKSAIYNKVCNSNETELALLYENFKTYVKEYKCTEKHDKNNLSVHNQILTYVKKKFSLTIEKISLKSKDSKITIIGFRVDLLMPLVRFGMSENAISAEKIALNKIIETLILYLK